MDSRNKKIDLKPSSAPLTTLLKEKLDHIISSLKKIFEKHPNRSKNLTKLVTDIVGQIIRFYRDVLILSPLSNKNDEIIPKVEVLEQSLLFTFSSFKNLKDADPFFDLLECISKIIILYIITPVITLVELKVLSDMNEKILAMIFGELNNEAEKSLEDFQSMEVTEKGGVEKAFSDPMTEHVGLLLYLLELSKDANKRLGKEKFDLTFEYLKIAFPTKKDGEILDSLIRQASITGRKKLANALRNAKLEVLNRNDDQDED